MKFYKVLNTKNISKKKVTVEKIFKNIKKRNLIITYENLQHILDKMVIDNILHESGSGVSRTYLIPEDPDKILVPDTQDISSNSNNNFLTENIILEETNLEQSTQEDTNVNHDNILNEIKSFKKFQADVESKLCLLEDTIIAGKEAKEITNDSSGFIINVLKDRISSLENELKSKDAIIEYLKKQLLSSNSKKSQMKNDKCNLNETFNGDESFYGNECSEESNMDQDKTIEQKKKVVFIGDSMLNGTHEKGMSKKYRVNNFAGGTSGTILENIDQLVKSKPDCLIAHAGTNDFANGTNLLNQAKK